MSLPPTWPSLLHGPGIKVTELASVRLGDRRKRPRFMQSKVGAFLEALIVSGLLWISIFLLMEYTSPILLLINLSESIGKLSTLLTGGEGTLSVRTVTTTLWNMKEFNDAGLDGDW